jgi:hypothetical protein
MMVDVSALTVVEQERLLRYRQAYLWYACIDGLKRQEGNRFAFWAHRHKITLDGQGRVQGLMES